MDDRQMGIKCHDCPKVQATSQMLCWHPTIGGYLAQSDAAGEYVCARCYLDRALAEWGKRQVLGDAM